MAPDINTLPQSSHRRIPSRQMTDPSSPLSSRSPAMGPPTYPASATNTVSNAQSARVTTASNDQMSEPLRHPRPLTAAELYLECEKEQEAVVNRLTRELTALRAQSASVASNASQSSASSTSLIPVDISDPNPAHQMIGPTHPTPSRRHRSSSSLSARSIPTPSTSVGSAVGSAHPQSHNANVHAGMSQASVDRAAAASGSSLSRQPSISASEASTPARRSIDLSRRQSANLHAFSHRPPLSRDTSYASQNTNSTTAQAGTPAPHRIPSPIVASLAHSQDTMSYRSEMEIVKAENEELRQRVRALERALRARRRDSSQSDVARPDSGRSDAVQMRHSRDTLSTSASAGAGVAAWAATGGIGGVAGPRERSESQSTTASSRRGIPVDEEVRVGESAASLANARGPGL